MHQKFQKNDFQIVYGKNPVIEAIHSDVEIDKIFVHNTLKGEFEIELRTKCKQFTIPLVKVPLEKLDHAANSRQHQGVVAFTSPVKFHKLEYVLPHLFESGNDFTLVILESVTDVRNIGAIARSALAFDIDYMIIPIKKTASITQDAVKASAGALLNLPLCREASLQNTVRFLKDSGVRVFASSLSADQSMEDVDWSGPKAIVIGSENNGVSREMLALVDETFIINQSTSVDSLNVSVASGIIFHEIYRHKSK